MKNYGLPAHDFAHVCYIDIETFGEKDITDVGMWAYSEAYCEILMVQLAMDEGPVRVFDLSRTEKPRHVAERTRVTKRLLRRKDVLFVAHNAPFERRMFQAVWGIDVPLAQWHCTMAQAYSHALPGALGDCGKALGIPEDQEKIKEGKALIRRFCKPAPRNHKADRYDATTHPEEWKQFKKYGRQDIVSMKAILELMPNINWDKEQWMLDQKINNYGIRMDEELTYLGEEADKRGKLRLHERINEVTGGAVARVSLRQPALKYLQEELGVDIPDTKKDTFLRYLKDTDEVDPQTREIMELMMAGNKSSTAKYGKLRRMLCEDGRYRGGFQYAGAGRTRRWAGRGMQLQNLPSRGIPSHDWILSYIDALKQGSEELLFDKLDVYGAAALRPMLLASQGTTMDVADLANIEGRLVSWFANEEWKLKAFKEYDAGKGPDLYKVTAAGILGGSPWDVSYVNRNAFGKVPELAFGFQGGAGALQTFAVGYGIRMSDFEDTLKATIDRRYHENAEGNWGFFGSEQDRPDARADMTSAEWRREWICSEVVKLAWRDRHPDTETLWGLLDDAARAAIQNPGRNYKAGKLLSFKVESIAGRRWLLLKLPSGRYITYLNPKINKDDEIEYSGVNPFTTKWGRVKIYGGKFLENAAQSTARDIMAENMLKIDDRGWKILLTVHDEVGAERDLSDDSLNLRDYTAQLAENPIWAKGLPLAAEGHTSLMYGKF